MSPPPVKPPNFNWLKNRKKPGLPYNVQTQELLDQAVPQSPHLTEFPMACLYVHQHDSSRSVRDYKMYSPHVRENVAGYIYLKVKLGSLINY